MSMRKSKVAKFIRKVDGMADEIYKMEREIREDLETRLGDSAYELEYMCFDPDTTELDERDELPEGVTPKDYALHVLASTMSLVRCSIESRFARATERAEREFKL